MQPTQLAFPQHSVLLPTTNKAASKALPMQPTTPECPPPKSKAAPAQAAASSWDQQPPASSWDRQPPPWRRQQPEPEQQPATTGAAVGEKPMNNSYSPQQVEHYKAESLLAKAAGVKWQDRGPRPEWSEMPDRWKGGTFRPNAKRWAKRGGAHLAERNEKYGKKKE